MGEQEGKGGALALLLVAALGGVYLPAQRLSAIMTPAPGAGP